MAGEQTGDNAQEKTSDSEAPYLKLSAREALNEGPKTTSSWTVLRNLKMSIIDGSVSILKKGISKITGSVSGFDATRHEKKPAAQENRDAQSERAAGTSETLSSGVPGKADLSAAGKDDTSQDEPADFGGDWIDDLLAELDATDLVPGASPASQSGAGQIDAPASQSTAAQGKAPASLPSVERVKALASQSSAEQVKAPPSQSGADQGKAPGITGVKPKESLAASLPAAKKAPDFPGI